MLRSAFEGYFVFEARVRYRLKEEIKYDKLFICCIGSIENRLYCKGYLVP